MRSTWVWTFGKYMHACQALKCSARLCIALEALLDSAGLCWALLDYARLCYAMLWPAWRAWLASARLCIAL